ncbi:MAG: type I restriction endonuclease subunit R [Cytophagales bacterium]|nr:type I restriction endonuclease subunit R [Cytophagales bacterium]
MTSKTNEQALEASIERQLTGTCLEELNENQVQDEQVAYRTGHGYYVGKSADFDAERALDTVRLWHFLETTQSKEIEKLKRFGGDWKLKILDRLTNLIKKRGVLHVLRKGLEIDDAEFILFYQVPLAISSDTVQKNFDKNEFSITRQVYYSVDQPNHSIDIVLFINGLPISTIELKNKWTGQTAKYNAIKQYKERDNKQALLQYGRCIVHFAMDTDEIYMTTKLSGINTFFLPFNKGNNYGKGNPVNTKGGHKTAYFWEDILKRTSLAKIIQHFVRMDGKPTDPLTKRTLFFPRYHQLDVVREILKDIGEKGVGEKYLIQHSAGSGKSNSITWLAYQLIELYPSSTEIQGSRGLEVPLFDSVVVVTDRRLLDKQIRDNIKGFSEVKNIVAPAYSSQELKTSLEQGKKIIITTIHKFPRIIDGIEDLKDKRFAVIIDEAHSSQGGTIAGAMNQVMGSSIDTEDVDEVDAQDKILEAMKTRKMRGNASYMAFTATPKNTTLEKFGTKQENGSYKAFHEYTMKQAIEEGFILDVLANYTTYKGYYEIEKSIEENPKFDTSKAQKKLRSYVEAHQQTIDTKAEIMIEHFITKVVSTKKLKGKAKAMVVTQSIEAAIRYYKAISRILENKNNPFKIAIAFSGKKKVDGIEYTEADLNGFADKKTKDEFDKDEYRVLVVANKYLTGFDQPKLSAMYVDKKLQSVLAVQALSRLNRSANKLNKKTEDLFILDFFNSVDDIKDSFDPFYTSTTLNKATDVNILHELKSFLDDAAVYEWYEVENFIEQYFNNVDAGDLSTITDTVAERFNSELDLEDDDKADFKIKAKQFVKIYGQMSAIMPYEIIKWEKLFWFLKFLIPKLVIKDKEKDLIDELLNSVDLSTYGLERVKLNHSIGLDDSESEVDPQNPNPRGAHGGDEQKDLLDEIIKSFNEHWFQGWDTTPEDQKVKVVSLGNHIKSHPDYEMKVLNNKDVQNQNIALNTIFDEVIAKQRRNELDLYKMCVTNDTFRQAFIDTIKKTLHL